MNPWTSGGCSQQVWEPPDLTVDLQFSVAVPVPEEHIQAAPDVEHGQEHQEHQDKEGCQHCWHMPCRLCQDREGHGEQRYLGLVMWERQQGPHHSPQSPPCTWALRGMPPPCRQQVPTRSPQGEGGRGIADPAGKHPKIGTAGEVELQDAAQELLRRVLARPDGMWGCRGSGRVVTPPKAAGWVSPGQALYQTVSWLLPLSSHCPSLLQAGMGWQCSVPTQRTVQFSSTRLPSTTSRVSLAAGTRISGGTLQSSGGHRGERVWMGKLIQLPPRAGEWCSWLFSHKLSWFGGLGRTLGTLRGDTRAGPPAVPAQGSFPAENRGELGFHLPAMALSGDRRGRCRHRKQGGQSPPASTAGRAGPGTDQERLRECWHREGLATPVGPRSDSIWGWRVLLWGKAKATSHPRPGGHCVTCPPCSDSQPGFPNPEFMGGR